MENRLSWYDWKRYSNRRQEKMLLGGMTGSVVYEGDLAPFMPLVCFCEQTHIGKQTALDWGRSILRVDNPYNIQIVLSEEI